MNNDVKARNIPELISILKSNAGRLSYGSPGVGTVHHLAMETFKRQAAVDIVHVPYKGAAAIIPDVISGQIQIGIISAPPALAQSKAPAGYGRSRSRVPSKSPAPIGRR